MTGNALQFLEASLDNKYYRRFRWREAEGTDY